MPHLLPALPYKYDALEPYIDAQTMRLHHDQHHGAYVAKLNSALSDHPDFRAHTAQWLMLNLGLLPREIRTDVRHNVGGHVNHSFLWETMGPSLGHGPRGALAAAIERTFGSYEQFKSQFNAAGVTLFGSGWVWLAMTQQADGGRLEIYTTTGHDNPLLRGHWPLLVNDVWEHAYYLKYENRRADYLAAWWAIVNWDAVAARFEQFENSMVEPLGDGWRHLLHAVD